MPTIEFEGQQHVFPDDFTQADIASALGSLPAKPSVGMDVAKQLGAGLVRGTEMIPEAPAQILGMAGQGVQALLPESMRNREAESQQEQIRNLASQARGGGISQYLPEPQTTAGQYARTTAEMLPSAATAPGSMLRNLAAGATGGLASEAAGQLTQGTAAEPYARAGAAVLGGYGALRTGEALAARQAAGAVPSTEDILANAAGTYTGLRSANVAQPIAQSELDNLIKDIHADVAKSGPSRPLAGAAHAAIDDINPSAGRQAPITQTKTILSGPGYHIAEDISKPQADIADLVSARQNMKTFFQNPMPDPNKAVASIAIPKIDAAIERLSPETMKMLRQADADYSAGKTSQTLDKKLTRAELRAAGEGSGMNLGNKIRQKAADMLLSDKESRGLTDANRTALEGVVRGTPTSNALRLVGNALGGGGGLGMTMVGALGAGAAGGYAAGHPELGLAPFAGLAARGLGNRLALRQIGNVNAMIRGRSPYAASLGATGPVPPLTRTEASLLAARLAAPAMRGILPYNTKDREERR